MAIKPEAMDKFLKEHSVGHRAKQAAEDKEALRRKAERMKELVGDLLQEPNGRELWYSVIADAEVLKLNAMTGNSQSFYILGLKEVATRNMEWVKKFHFKEWLLMEQEAYTRRSEEDHERGN